MNGSRTARDEEAVGRFVEWFALTLAEAGFPRMAARVFVGILIADDGRRTAAELAELLKVSPAAVSGAVRYLVQVGLVDREREPGQRRDHYRVHDDLWYQAITREGEMFGRWEKGLQEGVEVLGLDTPAGARVDDTRQFFAFLRSEFPALMQRWRAHRAVLSGGRTP
ncbi:MAG TPA: MarR family transcriptional regulator [Pseudonocardiaceae bacterium]|nr:MarR family transcriptional regulator [Pseudonocardiaceae bacterium]